MFPFSRISLNGKTPKLLKLPGTNCEAFWQVCEGLRQQPALQHILRGTPSPQRWEASYPSLWNDGQGMEASEIVGLGSTRNLWRTSAMLSLRNPDFSSWMSFTAPESFFCMSRVFLPPPQQFSRALVQTFPMTLEKWLFSKSFQKLITWRFLQAKHFQNLPRTW